MEEKARHLSNEISQISYLPSGREYSSVELVEGELKNELCWTANGEPLGFYEICKPKKQCRTERYYSLLLGLPVVIIQKQPIS